LAQSSAAWAADATGDDLARMQGDWMIKAMWSGGLKLPDEESQSLFRTVEGNTYTVSRYAKKISSGMFKLDGAASPKTIDSSPAVKPDSGDNTVQGIYEFDGPTLRIANALPGKPRPTNFKPKVGVTVIEWQVETR